MHAVSVLATVDCMNREREQHIIKVEEVIVTDVMGKRKVDFLVQLKEQ